MSLADNLAHLHNEIADAAARAHRSPSDIVLMAVSKMQPAEAVLEAISAGQRIFGENRVQEFAAKAPVLPVDCSVHLIGPLQNNKTSKAAELFHAVDTLDSLKTGERLNAAAAALGKHLSVLIEVKLSPEDTKHGIAPDDLPALLTSLAPLDHLSVDGLMTVPPFTEDPELTRPFFQHLRRLRDENIATNPTLTQLSMGMSHDFRVAIEEGSTTVRLGTAIFGQRT